METRAFCSAANTTDGGVTGHWYSYMIYLPPDYDAWAPTIEFPLVYSLHGTNGWGKPYSANVVQHLDQRILERRAEPAVYVFPYGGCESEFGNPPGWCESWMKQWVNRKDPVTDTPMRAELALWELFAHVEANYSVTDRREGLGIEGYSSGGGKAMHIGFRTDTVSGDIPAGAVYGSYPFGSVVGLSPGLAIEAADDPNLKLSCFENSPSGPGACDPPVHQQCRNAQGDCDPTITPRIEEYLSQHTVPEDGPVRLMVKYGDGDVDTNEVPKCWLNQGGLGLDVEDQVSEKCSTFATNVANDGWSFDSELVEPVCGQESDNGGIWEEICTVDLDPACPLGHEHGRMRTLRRDEILAFHQQDYWALPDLEDYQLTCTEPSGMLDASYTGPADRYLVGDWNGNGCDTVAIFASNKLYFDQSVDAGPNAVIGVTPFGELAVVRASSSGRDVLVDVDGAACASSETHVRILDPVTDPATVLADDCLAMAIGNQVLVGDFGNIDDVLPLGALDLGDAREDLAIRVGNGIYWFPQVAWGFASASGGMTTYGSSSDDFAAGYWSAEALIAKDTFFTTPGNQFRIDGEVTELGGLTWSADTEAIVRPADDGTLSVQLAGHPTLTAQGGVPFDATVDGRPVTIAAKINPQTSSWTGIGFADAAKDSYEAAGQLWVRIDPSGLTEVLADGNTVIESESLPGSSYRDLQLRFDPKREVWSLVVDGEVIFSERGLPTGFAPTITHVGFHIEASTPKEARIDDFSIDVDRLKQGALGVRRAHTGASRNDLLLNYELDSSHDLLYKFGAGDSEDEYLFGDWDGDGQSNVGVRRDCEILLDAPLFDGNGGLGGTAEYTYSIGSCSP